MTSITRTVNSEKEGRGRGEIAASLAHPSASPRSTRSAQKAALRNATDAQTLSPLQQMAKGVRQARECAGWSIAQAAAWTGVGTRFFLDLEMAKPSLQIEMALDVAQRMGVRIEIAVCAPAISPATLPMHSPDASSSLRFPIHPVVGPRYASSWLALHHAGLKAAASIGIRTHPCEMVLRDGRPVGLELRVEESAQSDSLQSLALALGCEKPAVSAWHVTQTPPSWLEENGGPSLERAVGFLRERSALPAADIEQLVRWMVLSNALLDSEHHLGRWLVGAAQNGLRLQPLGAVLAGSRFFEATPHKGLRIGAAWPDLYLRADHWKRMAEIAGVHPKAVFQIMQEVSATVPAVVEGAIESFTGSLPQSGPLHGVFKEIVKSCARMGELTLAARRHVSGLNTKSQQVVAPLEVRTRVAEPRRLVTTWDE